jgi:hypothetical protein
MKTTCLLVLSLIALATAAAPADARTPQPTSDSSSLPIPSAQPGECVMPWVIVGDPSLGPPAGYWGLARQQLFIGTFGPSGLLPVALYGNGSLDYRQAIATPCGSGDRGACDQANPRVWAGETLQCDVKTGIITLITDDALTQRYGASTDCDATTHEQALALAGTEACKDRAVFVPIVDDWPPPGEGGGTMHILDIATFYIASWDRTPPWGDQDLNGDTLPDGAMVWGYFLPPPAVGGIVELYSDGSIGAGMNDTPSPARPPFAPLIGGLVAASLAVSAGAWYTRRRLRRS